MPTAYSLQPTAYSLKTLHFALGCVMLLSLFSGCDRSDASSVGPVALSEDPSKPIVIDAGIILAGQPNYLCFPLEKFGISSADEILQSFKWNRSGNIRRYLGVLFLYA